MTSKGRLSASLLLMIRHPPISTLFPYTTLFRSPGHGGPSVRKIRSPARDFDRAPRAWSPVEPVSRENSDSAGDHRSEEHTSELQSQFHLVCRLLLEKKKRRHLSRKLSLRSKRSS